VEKVLSLAAIVILMGGVASACRPPDTPHLAVRPRLIVDDSVAPDFRALAEETWAGFLETFEARADCFGDVRLQATRTLDSRASYDPKDATVTVRVPGTPAMLQSALIHEWAHHLEFQCQAQKSLRPAFLAAQGLPPDTPWRPADASANMPASAWANVPSEQYAEATVALVLGRRPIPTKARVTREAIRVVAEWAAGD